MTEILRMDHISKAFPGVKALDNVHFDLLKGEVHAIAGENGAGKSTFMKILTGIYTPDTGEIIFDGQPYIPVGPKYAQELGISIIHQELNLLPDLSVANNIYIGREQRRFGIIIDDKRMIEEAQALLHSLGLTIDARTTVRDLSIAERQMVEIAKALSVKAKILVLDEPTSALSLTETDTLFTIIRKLRSEGTSIIYISHRLEEFNQIADRVTVLRDGKYITTKEWASYSIPELIREMVGREMNDKFPKRDHNVGEIIFEVKNLKQNVNGRPVIKDVSFSVHEGEVLGFAGLMGSGRTEVARAIIGADRLSKGEIWLRNKKMSIKTPNEAISNGITYLPEDRKDSGLFLNQSVTFNITIATLQDRARLGIISDRAGEKIVAEKVAQLSIKTPTNDQMLQYLSGGNQQKVLVARWMCRDFDVVIFDEPTRGIDVGAKYEVFNLINQIARSGAAVIMISSEMEELLGMSDRILVMCEGHIAGIVDAQKTNQEQIMALASGSDNTKSEAR